MDLADLTHINVMRAKRWHPGFPDDDTWTIADWSNAMAATTASSSPTRTRR